MLKTVEGIYDNGKIELKEIPQNIPPQTKVIVTFLTILEEDLIKKSPYSDLDFMINTWNEQQEVEFITNTQQLHKIDQKIWD